MKKLILLSISAIALTLIGTGCAGGAGGSGGSGGAGGMGGTGGRSSSAAGATSTGSIRAQPHSNVGVGTNTSAR